MRSVLADPFVFPVSSAHAQGSIISLNPSFASSACPYPATAATDGCNSALATLGSSVVRAPTTLTAQRLAAERAKLHGLLGGQSQPCLPSADEQCRRARLCRGASTAYAATLKDPKTNTPANCTWYDNGSLATPPLTGVLGLSLNAGMFPAKVLTLNSMSLVRSEATGVLSYTRMVQT